MSTGPVSSPFIVTASTAFAVSVSVMLVVVLAVPSVAVPLATVSLDKVAMMSSVPSNVGSSMASTVKLNVRPVAGPRWV